MSEGTPKGGIGDLLGVKPIAEAVNKVTSAAVDGAAAVLSRVCLPAAEEFGKLVQDRVSNWRALQLIALTKKLEKKLTENKVPTGSHAHPRLVNLMVEQGSWVEDSQVQDMWAGLVASSCTPAGDDDSNLIFMNLLAGLTRLQARLLKYACEKAPKEVMVGGLLLPNHLIVSVDELCAVAQETDIHRLDREMDSLRAASLLGPRSGFSFYASQRELSRVDLTPTPLALHMYVRCQGSRATPDEFFGLASPASPQQAGSSQAPSAPA